MKIALVGCGLMGLGAAAYLLKQKELSQLLLIDSSKPMLDKLKLRFQDSAAASKLEYLQLDIQDQGLLLKQLLGYDVVASALPWPATRDLLNTVGKISKSLVSITRPDYQEIKMLEQAWQNSRTQVLLGCGLEPGLTEIFAAKALEDFYSIQELHLRCGGIPLQPRPPLSYLAVFNSKGLPLEPREAYWIDQGVLKTAPRFSGEELIPIKGLGVLEAWHDGMLPWLLELPGLNQARIVTQKTLRWPGFAKTVHFLNHLGFLSREMLKFKGIELSPKEMVDLVLLPKLGFEEQDRDLVVLELELKGVHKQTGLLRREKRRWVMPYDEVNQISAMAKITGTTLGHAAILMAQGGLNGRGLLRPEISFRGLAYQHLERALKTEGMTSSLIF